MPQSQWRSIGHQGRWSARWCSVLRALRHCSVRTLILSLDMFLPPDVADRFERRKRKAYKWDPYTMRNRLSMTKLKLWTVLIIVQGRRYSRPRTRSTNQPVAFARDPNIVVAHARTTARTDMKQRYSMLKQPMPMGTAGPNMRTPPSALQRGEGSPIRLSTQFRSIKELRVAKHRLDKRPGRECWMQCFGAARKL